MPRIFDNIELELLPALTQSLSVSERADFCVGYFNLRGWKKLAGCIEPWSGGEGHCCRLMVGMQRTPQEELKLAVGIDAHGQNRMDLPQAKRLKLQLAREFRRQLMLGTPTNEDEAGLRTLARQLREKKLIVKLFLKHPLHAKLYLLFRDDYNNPISGYLGSSNLTLSGLSYQGELNVDVLDHDACQKLARWFDERWEEMFCLDISQELIEVIEESWASETPPTPYEIYLKMAYHLAQEARTGLGEFIVPPEFRDKLFKFQAEAVRIAARYLNRQGGVIIGDVVGLGKTLIATALARVIEERESISTLIICPKNLETMWQGYVDRYGLRAKVMPSSVLIKELPEVPGRFRLVIIDESHNFRNRESKRYRALKDYLDSTDSRCILLSATPYNKTYLDLSAQLRLFVPEYKNLGIRPEQLLREMNPTQLAQLQVAPNTLAAFEKSTFAEDWRDLMRLFLIRRTRSFIKAHYALTEPGTDRKYLVLEDDTYSYFPERKPRTLKFNIDDDAASDQYARLYSDQVVDVIQTLSLPRYGLGNYLRGDTEAQATSAERKTLGDLSRAGKRLLGYCRTGLFKRLESSGHAFVQSLDRHILRNFIFVYALETGQPLPVGTQDAAMLDPGINDADVDDVQILFNLDEDDAPITQIDSGNDNTPLTYTEAAYRERAKEIYRRYQGKFSRRFKWLRPVLFAPALKRDLLEDAARLISVLNQSGGWDPTQDRKLARLEKLIKKDHSTEKILVFSQFADTVEYLAHELQARGVNSLAGVTAQHPNPSQLAWRFSPASNDKRIPPAQELRVLIATDVLSEGQNLQDAAIVVNYDLPWTIIRLIQRAGRVDRIGQKAEEVLCYSFLPADGVERIIHLRHRVKQRLRENGEVLGTDEQFFNDEQQAQDLRDLYTEKAGVLDDEADDEVDLNSEAYAIWNKATKDNAELARRIENMPDVVFSARSHSPSAEAPDGVLVYARTADDTDALAWVNQNGERVTHSQLQVLRAAACAPDTPSVTRHPDHHRLVQQALAFMQADEHLASSGGLGPRTGARYKTYTRLTSYFLQLQARQPLFASPELEQAIDALARYPLREVAKDILNQQLKAGISDEDLGRLVVALRSEGRLSVIPEEDQAGPPELRIICSLGLVQP